MSEQPSIQEQPRPILADGTPVKPGSIDLANMLAEAAAAIDQYDSVLEGIVGEAQRAIPGTDEAGISLLTKNRVTTAAPSSPLVAAIDNLQNELREGPCVDAIFEHEYFRTGDLAAEARWPNFAPAVADKGVRSVLAYRLAADSQTFGALNLYSTSTDAFDEQSVQVARSFATHAALAYAHEQQKDRLREAIDSRDLIGMAKGILMQRFSIDDERAFSLLVHTSQRSQRKLREIAEQVVEDQRTAARSQQR
jgi:GAF domain-containing protein